MIIITLLQCDIHYTTETRLKEHLRKRHGVANLTLNFTCNINQDHPDIRCNEAFLTATKFIQHMKQVHRSKPWLCNECPELKRFQERQNYQFHKMTHDGKRGFVCDICSKSFANPRQLYSHRSLHLGKRFLCPHCGYRARSTANLR